MHPRTRLIAVITVVSTIAAVVLAETGVAPALEPSAVVAAYVVVGVSGWLIDRTRHRRATVLLATVVAGLLAILVAWIVTAIDVSMRTCGALPLNPACPGQAFLQMTGTTTLIWVAPLGALFAIGAAGTRWGRWSIAIGLLGVMIASLLQSAGYPAVTIEGLWVGVLRALVALALGMGALAYGRAIGLSAAA